MSTPKIPATSLSSDQDESSSASDQGESLPVPDDVSSSVSDPNEPVVWSCSLLPSTRVTAADCVDRPTMADMVAALYDRLESYEEIAQCYGSLEEALREEKHRGDAWSRS